jgi:hypothetical protein
MPERLWIGSGFVQKAQIPKTPEPEWLLVSVANSHWDIAEWSSEDNQEKTLSRATSNIVKSSRLPAKLMTRKTLADASPALPGTLERHCGRLPV